MFDPDEVIRHPLHNPETKGKGYTFRYNPIVDRWEWWMLGYYWWEKVYISTINNFFNPYHTDNTVVEYGDTWAEPVKPD